MKRFLFEVENFTNSKKTVIVSVIFLIFSIVSVYLSILEYESFLKEKKNFVEHEKIRVDSIDTYQNYGVFGNRVIFEKSPLNILIKGISFKNITESNVDTNAILKIGKSERGKSRFTDDADFPSGFGNLIYLFGSLLALYFGTSIFTGLNNLKLYKKFKDVAINIFCRMFIFGLYITALFGIAYLILRAWGIHLSGGEIKAFLLYLVYILALLMLFFFAGSLIAMKNTKRKGVKYFYAGLVWLFFVIVIPKISSTYISFQANEIRSVEELNMIKFKRLMIFEDESAQKFSEAIKKKNADPYELARKYMDEYMAKVFPENLAKEKAFIEEEKKIIRLDEFRSLFFPTTYFQFLTKEITGNGNYGYLRFTDYILLLKEKFQKYYNYKRYYEKDKTVDNFIKSDENIFKATPIIPPSYLKAMGILFFFILLFAALSFLKIYQTLKGNPKQKQPDWKLDDNTAYYKFYEKDDQRINVFQSFETNPNITCLSKFHLEDLEPKINIQTLLDYLCRIRNVQPENVHANLVTLDLPGIWKQKKIPLDSTLIKKIYLAVILAEKNQLIVINDFIKNEDRDFDQSFRQLLQSKVDEGKTIVYLSSNPPNTENRKNIYKQNDHPTPITGNINIISFR